MSQVPHDPIARRHARESRVANADVRPSSASQRLRALADLSGSLTDALTPSAAADLVEQKALAALGASSAVVVTLGAFPPPLGQVITHEPDPAARLHVVHAVGGERELFAALEAQPLDAPLPFAEVARSGQPLYLDASDVVERYPDWGASMIEAGVTAVAVVPVWANGELRGVLGLTWRNPRVFDEDERAFVTTLGVMCAQAIMRAHLKAAEREARERAEAANLEKVNFVATVSHELRSPLSAVMNYTELLARELGGPTMTRQLTRVMGMRASGTHLLALLDELLGHARIDAGEESVRVQEVALHTVVHESVALVLPLAEARGLAVAVDVPETTITLMTDPLKLRQVLVNLVANAVRHARKDDVHVIARLDGVGEVRIRLTVTDDGVGVANEDRDDVFKPFWQKSPIAGLPGSASSSGLGLSVARHLARLLGGELELADGERSSTFVLTLPVRPPTP